MSLQQTADILIAAVILLLIGAVLKWLVLF
jgi:hypothetical protein